MSLTQAIDALLAFVDAHEATHEAIPLKQQPKFDVSQFEALDREVYRQAHKLGLQGELPPQNASAFNGPIAFIGKTNLPGNWMLNGTFAPIPTRRWRTDLLALGSLAEAGGTPEAEQRAKRISRPRKPRSGGEALAPKEFLVLSVLQKEHPCRVLLYDLAAKSEIAVKTCGKIVKSLIKRGLADRPSERKGVGITAVGNALLAVPAKSPLMAR